MKFPTAGGRDVVLHKIVYDAYHNNFTRKAKALENQYKRKYTRRRQSAPSTVFGRALTVGEELSIIKEYNESQAKRSRPKNNEMLCVSVNNAKKW